MSLRIMGMETLNNAARAAGYAMATADELLNNKVEAKPENSAWRPGEAIMPSAVAPPSVTAIHTVTSWVKGRFFSVLGRGAPA
jgi:hypothetical protein